MFKKLWFKKDNIGVGINILSFNRDVKSTIVHYMPLGTTLGSTHRSSEITGWGELKFSLTGRVFLSTNYPNSKYDYSTNKFYSLDGETIIDVLENWDILPGCIQIKKDSPLGRNFFPDSVYGNEVFFWMSFKAPRKNSFFVEWDMDVEYDK